MNVKQHLQELNNRLDKARRKLSAAQQREDAVLAGEIERDIRKLQSEIAANTELKQREASSEVSKIKAMAFSRAISKQEQADMGKLKKSVKGLVVVHPMTAIGRQMGLKEMTGFAPAAF